MTGILLRPAGMWTASPPQAHSLRQSAIFSIVSIVAVTMLLTASVTHFLVSQYERRTWEQRQLEATRFAGDVVAGSVARVQDYLVYIGALPVAHLTASPDIIRQHLAGNPAVLEIVRFSSGGEILAAASADRPVLANSFTAGQSVWFQVARSNHLYMGVPQVASDSEPYAIVAVPSADKGVVAARLRMLLLWQLVSDMRFGRTGSAYVITPDGLLIAHASPELVLSFTTLAGTPEMDAIRQAPQHAWHGSYTNFRGVRVSGLTRDIPGLDWIIVTEISRAETTTGSRQAVIAIALGMTLMGALMVVGFYRGLDEAVLRPLGALRGASVQVAQGNFAHRVDTEKIGFDEFHVVAAAFNQMTQELRQRQEELAAAAAVERELEERKRTQLERFNHALGQRQAELVKMTDELLRSNKELQEFAYVASHDLQEPLRKVRAFGDRLAERYGAVLDDRGRDYIIRMQSGAQRMQTLIDALLTYSRVTTKAQPFAPTELNEVVAGVLSDLETRIAQAAAHVVVEPLDVIYADAHQMRQLLQNLIGNAIKFHKPDTPPVVHICGEWIATPADANGADGNGANGNGSYANGNGPGAGTRSYRLIVQDNGIGFDPQYATRIFDVFERLHGRGEYEGTGIGLAICRKIVVRHGGKIHAVSAPDQGATFVITFPDHSPTVSTEAMPVEIVAAGAVPAEALSTEEVSL